ncbi:MAG: sodium-dependent bicarbonate transport family permease [Devosia sp.]
MRLALPEADIGLPLAMSLAITFPYNVLIGIPLLGWLAQLLA